jgi:hypothetical protein
MAQPRVIQYEMLECRRLAVGMQDGVELWWKLNLLRTLSNDGIARLALNTPTLARQALAPLAWNGALHRSSQGHAVEMSEHNYFSHQSEVDGRWPNQMVRDQGYPLPLSLSSQRNDVETLLAGTQLQSVDAVMAEILQNDNARNQLFPSAKSASLATEIGIGGAHNGDSTFDYYWSTQVAGRHQGERFLTGIVYSDQNGNQNFDAGEGVAGIRVTSGELSTLSDTNGVYALAVGGGRHHVRFENAAQQTLAESTLFVGERSIVVDLRVNDAMTEINYRKRSWWTNADNHVDVNRDQHVNPIDALVIINQLNRTGPQILSSNNPNPAFASNAVDTNGDSNVSATDALVVINYLNRA